MKATLPLALLTLFGAAGCHVALPVAGAVVVSEEFQDNAVSTTVPEKTKVVWPSVLSSLSGMTDALIHRDDEHHAAHTRIDSGVVTVHVWQPDTGETQIRVAAKKFLVYNHELSQMVMDRIVNELRAAK
jgi:hypothetical protein